MAKMAKSPLWAYLQYVETKNPRRPIRFGKGRRGLEKAMVIGLWAERPHPVKCLLEGVHHLLRLDGDGVARNLRHRPAEHLLYGYVCHGEDVGVHVLRRDGLRGAQRVRLGELEAAPRQADFHATRRGEAVVVDLPSGYSPRGFRVSDAGKRYYGFDLPSVIDVMKPACEKTMTEEQKKLTLSLRSTRRTMNRLGQHRTENE